MPVIQIYYEQTFIACDQRKKTKKIIREEILKVKELGLSKAEQITVQFIRAETTGEEEVIVHVFMDKRKERTRLVQCDVANVVRTEIATVQNRTLGSKTTIEVFVHPFDQETCGFAG